MTFLARLCLERLALLARLLEQTVALILRFLLQDFALRARILQEFVRVLLLGGDLREHVLLRFFVESALRRDLLCHGFRWLG